MDHLGTMIQSEVITDATIGSLFLERGYTTAEDVVGPFYAPPTSQYRDLGEETRNLC